VLTRGDAAAFKEALEALSPEKQRHVAAMLEVLQHEAQIVAGERDAGVLTEGIDEQERVLITQVLDLLIRSETSPGKDS
jgi:hypothetical protein